MTIRSGTPLALVLLFAAQARGQALTLPPSGDNPRSTLTQQVGPVTVSVEYSSPRVVLKGDDRKGKIWGALVPYGLTDLGFNDCTKCPWRAGANENTVFAVSHDVKIQGQPLAAGRYGLHMIPGKEEWTVIFSRNSSSWGSFSYDHEWLNYEFTEREPAKATLALQWEELALPFSITVENAPAVYAAKFKDDLRGSKGFDWHNYQQAAEYCLQNKVALADGLTFAQKAINPNLGGDENFSTLMTLSKLQAANGHADEGQKTFDKALASPGAKPIDLHLAARALLQEGKKQEALKIFQLNAQRFPNQWPVHVGLMRGLAATGDLKGALSEARLARDQSPDAGNKKNLDRLVKLLEEGKSID